MNKKLKKRGNRLLALTLSAVMTVPAIWAPVSFADADTFQVSQEDLGNLVTDLDPATIYTKTAFTDVDRNAWYEADVYSLLNSGVVSGYGDGTFKPSSEVSRAEFLKMLIMQSGTDFEAEYITTDVQISDVPMTHWAYPYVAWALDRGIVQGYEDGSFHPNASITREEAAVIITGFTGALTSSSDPGAGFATCLDKFSDKSKVSSWAELAVMSVVNDGTISGYEDGTLRPQGKLTRAETAKIMNKLVIGSDIEGPDGPETPQVSTTGNFSDDLMTQVYNSEKGNFMVSPYSAKIAMAMSANGAKGRTQTEILNALGIEDLSKFNSDIKSQMAKYKESSEAITVDVNNSIWANSSRMLDFSFLPSYKKLIADYFNGEAGVVNDSNAVKTINDWISDKTRGKIQNCIDQPDFSTALVNTLYFKAQWLTPFEEFATKKDTFTQADGTKKETDFMNMTDYFPHYLGSDVQVLELPYSSSTFKKDEYGFDEIDKDFDQDISMYIIVSEKPVLNPENVLDSVSMTGGKVKVAVPKFEFKYKTSLVDALKAMGINLGFKDPGCWTPAADFTGMTENLQYIGDVIQSTFISVDEEGTEAAAATVVLNLEATMFEEQPPVFRADKPFTFVIRDNKTKEILFEGRYAEVE